MAAILSKGIWAKDSIFRVGFKSVRSGSYGITFGNISPSRENCESIVNIYDRNHLHASILNIIISTLSQTTNGQVERRDQDFICLIGAINNISNSDGRKWKRTFDHQVSVQNLPRTKQVCRYYYFAINRYPTHCVKHRCTLQHVIPYSRLLLCVIYSMSKLAIKVFSPYSCKCLFRLNPVDQSCVSIFYYQSIVDGLSALVAVLWKQFVLDDVSNLIN